MNFDITKLKRKDQDLVSRVVTYLEDKHLDVELVGSAKTYVESSRVGRLFKNYDDVDILVKYLPDPAYKSNRLEATKELKEAYELFSDYERYDGDFNIPEFGSLVTGYNFASLSQKEQSYCNTLIGDRFEIIEKHKYGKYTIVDLSFESEIAPRYNPVNDSKKNTERTKSTVSLIERIFNPYVTDRISPKNMLVRSKFED